MQIYWINSEEMKIIYNGVCEVLTPNQVLIKYGENHEIMNEIKDILKKPKKSLFAIYDKLLNECSYDEAYYNREKSHDRKMNLSAYEIMIKNIMRTKKDKKGTSETFAMRLKDELDLLEIENYLLLSEDNDNFHFANLYLEDNNMYVCDLSIDLIDKQITLDQEDDIEHLIPLSHKINLTEYLEDNPISYVLEIIRDNGKRMQDLKMKRIKDFVIDYELKH